MQTGEKRGNVTEKQEHTHLNTNLKWKSRWNVISTFVEICTSVKNTFFSIQS